MKDPETFEPMSQTAYFLETYVGATRLSSATCFFIKRHNKLYLVTNWHVVSGKHSETKRHLSQHLAEPDKLVVKVFRSQAEIESIDFVVALYDESGCPLWKEHPTYGSDVDVVLIQVSMPSDSLVFDVEMFIEPFNEQTTIAVKEDVFVLGFPFGYRVEDVFPIWKRASVASEPVIDIKGLPKFLVDTASRSGMSGSPVIKIQKRAVPIADGPPDKSGVKVSSNHMAFAGVYSGRIGAEDEIGAQLGIVWKSRVLNEILDGPVVASQL